MPELTQSFLIVQYIYLLSDVPQCVQNQHSSGTDIDEINLLNDDQDHMSELFKLSVAITDKLRKSKVQ